MAPESPREQVSDLVQSAKDAARQTIDNQKDAVAANLGNFAGTLRNSAKEQGAEGQDVGSIAAWAADGLERASTALRTQDLTSMLHTAEDFARKQPLVFFFAAAAAGFLVTRFVKAGAETTDERFGHANVPLEDRAAPATYGPPPMNPM